jgi:hypothetical protein
MQELILNACLFEKFGENCAVKLIDENSIQCDKFPDQIFKREEELLRSFL